MKQSGAMSNGGAYSAMTSRLSAIAIALAMLALSIAPSSATSQPRARGLHEPRPFDCGFDPHGAQEELAQGRMRALRRSRQGARSEAIGKRLRANDVGDTAVIEDDGSIIVPPSAFNLKKSSVLFTPEGGGYRIARTSVPFTSDFGSRVRSFLAIDGQPGNADNGYHEIEFAGSSFPFYGIDYDRIFIGTNGYITFNQGDTSARVSATTLAVDLPRIAPLWADLDASTDGAIYYNRLDGRHVITWDGVPQSIYGGLSTFQAVLYDDGRIAFIYKKVKARSSLVGISPGGSDQEAQPVDFTNPPAEAVNGPLFESFSKLRSLDVAALMRAFYSTHTDEVDSAYIWADFAYDNGLGVAHSFNVRNDISGIGLKRFDRGALYGSPSRLATIITMGDQNDWPGDPQKNTAGLNSAVSIVCHELGHRWLVYVQTNGDDPDVLLGRDNSHWSFFLDTRTNAAGSISSLMEGNAWQESSSSFFVTSEAAVNYFSPLDEYLMGLRPPEEVAPFTYLQTDSGLHELLREKSPVSGFSLNAVKRTADIGGIIEREGPRVPDASRAPKAFRVAFILLTESGAGASAATLAKMSDYRDALVRYFATATDRLATLDATLIRK